LSGFNVSTDSLFKAYGDESSPARRSSGTRRNGAIALVNGDRFQVDHPEALVVRDGVAVFIAAGGVPTLFDHTSVSQLVGEPLP
jgi:hypothetical protein